MEVFKFFIASPRNATSDVVVLFIDALVERCPHLEDFLLSMHVESAIPQDVFGIKALGVSVLEAIARIPNLLHLRMEHTMPISVRDSDMAILAPLFSRLLTLSLNPHPLVLQKPEITMLSVAHLARYCPSIDYLGLYLDGRCILGVVDLHDRHRPCFTHYPFIFDVGLSPAPNNPSPEALDVLAEFVACLIPVGADLQTGFQQMMFDSVEFTPVDVGMHGLVPAAEADLERHHQVWEIVEVLATMMRPLLPVVEPIMEGDDE